MTSMATKTYCTLFELRQKVITTEKNLRQPRGLAPRKVLDWWSLAHRRVVEVVQEASKLVLFFLVVDDKDITDTDVAMKYAPATHSKAMS